MKYAKVLIVDDDQQVLDNLKHFLDDDMLVITARNGRQAVDYMTSNKVDIILLDVEMPIMNGFITLERLRNLKNCINIPIIMITGKNDKGTVLKCMSKGIDDYIIKPVNKSVLKEKINNILDHKPSCEGKKTVLTIDDDMNFLKTIRTHLCDEYNVIMINSSKLAMEYLSKYVPDIILLDYNMPLYNGTAVLSYLQKENNSLAIPYIPVIIFSGNLDRELIQECVRYNPAAYLAKPTSKEKLKETIKRVLDSHKN